MSRSFYLLLEIPAERGAGILGDSGRPADLHQLLAQSRLRVVPPGAVESLRPGAAPALSDLRNGHIGTPARSLEEVERDYILEILADHAGNRSRAAKVLNISRRTLQRKMAQFNGAGGHAQ